jgi:hypothetical protein
MYIPNEILMMIFEYIPLSQKSIRLVNTQFNDIDQDTETRRKRKINAILKNPGMIQKEQDLEVVKRVFNKTKNQTPIYPQNMNFIKQKSIVIWAIENGLFEIKKYYGRNWSYDIVEALIRCNYMDVECFEHIKHNSHIYRKFDIMTLLWKHKAKIGIEFKYDDNQRNFGLNPSAYDTKIMEWLWKTCQILPPQNVINRAFDLGWEDVMSFGLKHNLIVSNYVLDERLIFLFSRSAVESWEGGIKTMSLFYWLHLRINNLRQMIDWLHLNNVLDTMIIDFDSLDATNWIKELCDSTWCGCDSSFRCHCFNRKVFHDISLRLLQDVINYKSDKFWIIR